MERTGGESLEARLKVEALRLGFAAAGITDAGAPEHHAQYLEWLARGFHGTMTYMARSERQRASVDSLLSGAVSIVAVAMSYNQVPSRQPDSVRIARYALGRDYHKVVRGRLRRLGAWLAEEHPEARSRVCVDSAPMLEREYAHRAGLGWFGKNTLLIDSHRGSWFVIGFLLTTVPLAPDHPATGGCGRCRACIDACPTGAIVHEGGRWQVDSRKCISYLTIEHRGPFTQDEAKSLGDWTFGCDVCQDVCPFNRPRSHQPARAELTQIEDFRARGWPSLKELESIGSEEWDVATQGSAVRRAGREGLARNARANLRNIQAMGE